MASQNRLEGLDAMRGLAAVAVVFAHTIFVGQLPVPDSLRMTAGRFTLAVEMFFVLSAFSLCVRYYGRLNSPDDMRDYFLRRILRIVPLFYVLAAIWIAWRYYQSGGLPSIEAFVTTVTFTFGFVPALHGSIVAPGWSIGVEMIFYLIFPLLLLVIRGWRSALLAFALALVLSVLTADSLSPEYKSFRRQNMAVQMPCFMAGIGAYLVYARLKTQSAVNKSRISYGLICLVLLYWLIAWFTDAFMGNGEYRRNMLIAAGFPVLVVAIALHAPRVLVNGITLKLGLWSYGIYLTHWLVIRATETFRIEAFAAEAVGGIWPSLALSFGTILIVTVSSAAFLYSTVERPFQNMGRAKVEGRAIPIAPGSPA